VSVHDDAPARLANAIAGPYRTLTQDVSFGIDQLVEIGLRALSAAVNDTFTALTCIDWLGENLCKIVTGWHPARVHRDTRGFIRVIAPEPAFDRLVQRSFEKIRQSSLGMPAVMIRELDALARIMAETTSSGQRRGSHILTCRDDGDSVRVKGPRPRQEKPELP
jgi:uncharacterized membrane protein